LAEARVQYLALKVRVETSRALLLDVYKRMKEIELVQKDRANNLRLFDAVSVPKRPVYPLRRLAVLLLGGGGLVALAWIFHRLRAEAYPGSSPHRMDPAGVGSESADMV
jgi:uncharacterized protein involved in exopolysaccharide biosynthesis